MCQSTRDPVILGVSEHLGVRLPLGVVGVGVDPEPQVCSGFRFKLEEGPEGTFYGTEFGNLDSLFLLAMCS